MLSTGAYPWRTGIVANRVMNRSSGKEEPIFWDAAHPVLEAPPGVGGRLARGAARRDAVRSSAAVHCGGREGDRALGQGTRRHRPRRAPGSSVLVQRRRWDASSPERRMPRSCPGGSGQLNERRLPDAAFGTEWALLLPSKEYVGEDDRPFEARRVRNATDFRHPLSGGAPAAGPPSYAAFACSPGGNELLVQAAKARSPPRGWARTMSRTCCRELQRDRPHLPPVTAPTPGRCRTRC